MTLSGSKHAPIPGQKERCSWEGMGAEKGEGNCFPFVSDLKTRFSFFPHEKKELHFSTAIADLQVDVCDCDATLPCRRRPYCVECTGSLLTSEVKQRRARSVLGWGTAWEDLRVLSAFVVPQGLHPFHCCLEELLDPCHFGSAFQPCGLLA